MGLVRITQDRGGQNRKLVLSEILRKSGISRTEIGDSLGLNIASVSRITRELIDAGFARETAQFGPDKRPGRRFVGLAPNGKGGFVIGIGINAFRQSVTLANLENEKIAEWISPRAPTRDGLAFFSDCLDAADQLLRDHVADRQRFFGVGIAVAAEIDAARGEILNAPVFGWDEPIALAKLVRERLDAPLVLDVPSSSINKAEADCGLGQGVENLATLHCSLGFGIGIRRPGDDHEMSQEFGRVLTQSNAPDGSARSLSEMCGGISILLDTNGADYIANRSDTELGNLLVAVIAKSATDQGIKDILFEKGGLTAKSMSIVFDIFQPDRLLLAGPLATSNEYVTGFSEALKSSLARSTRVPDIRCSDMTPAGASRWLALRGTVAMANLNLQDLKIGKAA